MEALETKMNRLFTDVKKLKDANHDVSVDAGGGFAQALMHVSKHGTSAGHTGEALLEDHRELREQVSQLSEEKERMAGTSVSGHFSYFQMQRTLLFVFGCSRASPWRQCLRW